MSLSVAGIGFLRKSIYEFFMPERAAQFPPGHAAQNESEEEDLRRAEEVRALLRRLGVE
jgi:hypothetical protein